MQKRWNITFSHYIKQLIGTLLFIMEMCIDSPQILYGRTQKCAV